ncbi:MAG: HAMP domain-containing histidine kinase [Erythrobacter sp.]|nr:HAMP domain-containing histidine kinase [Erythrobacter sp.]
MQFDDRLATVLRKRAASDAAARTQLRQLLDLLGTRETLLRGPAMARIARTARSLPQAERDRLLFAPALTGRHPRLGTMAGFVRLDELQQSLPQEDQSAILREPGLRLRNPALVAFLAEGEPKPAASAMATAQLDESQWLALIPALPVTARGFLRHRRDLPPAARDLLQRLGVRDLVLPNTVLDLEIEAEEVETPPSPAPPPAEAGADEGIAALRKRIEAFRQTRPATGAHPRLPLGDVARDSAPETLIEVVTDTAGVVVQAEGRSAAMLAGLVLTAPRPGALVQFDDRVAIALRRRQPLRQARLAIDAAPAISGDWRIDAVPRFDPVSHGFAGYAARLYRLRLAEPDAPPAHPGDAMRQVLHELRTPVNAIQGFAEIIQQQLFGNVPHEYRAHAAAIAGDAAMLLAGFDEVDRMVKLDAGAMALDDGECDLREALTVTVARLEGALRSREAGFALVVEGDSFAIPLAREEAMVLCWRLLATAAGALGPGERAPVTLAADGEQITLTLSVPAALRDAGPDNGRDGQRRRAISAGMFGPRFSFRLAEAEARAVGGSLACQGDQVVLTLPTLAAPIGAAPIGVDVNDFGAQGG